ELGVRLAIGASRGRIVRQLLAENLLLSILAGGVGLMLAAWTMQILQPLVASHLPVDWVPEFRRMRFLDISPDLRVAFYTSLLAVVATLAAGLLPALHVTRGDLVGAIKNDRASLGTGASQSKLRNRLIVAQIAISLMLLSCLGLVPRNLSRMRGGDYGFD